MKEGSQEENVYYFSYEHHVLLQGMGPLLTSLIKRLSDKERIIIQELYTDSKDRPSRVLLSAKLGVSRARVSQLEKRALRKLRLWLLIEGFSKEDYFHY